MFDKDLPRLIPLVCDSVFGPCIFLGHHHHEINVSKGRASFVGSDNFGGKIEHFDGQIIHFQWKKLEPKIWNSLVNSGTEVLVQF